MSLSLNASFLRFQFPFRLDQLLRGLSTTLVPAPRSASAAAAPLSLLLLVSSRAQFAIEQSFHCRRRRRLTRALHR